MLLTREVAITGTSFHKGAMDIVGRLKAGSPLRLVRDAANKYDKNALAIYYADTLLGYLPRPVAKEFAPWVDAGNVVTVKRSTSPVWGVLTLEFVS